LSRLQEISSFFSPVFLLPLDGANPPLYVSSTVDELSWLILLPRFLLTTLPPRYALAGFFRVLSMHECLRPFFPPFSVHPFMFSWRSSVVILLKTPSFFLFIPRGLTIVFFWLFL